MKTVYSTLIIGGLLLFVGCKLKTESNNQNINADTIQATKLIRIKTRGNHLVAQQKSNPDTLTIDAAKTAVIVIDMENDFGSKGGMFDLAGIPISDIQKAVQPTSDVLATARQAGIKIIYIKMAYSPDLSDVGDEGSINRLQDGFYAGDTITAPNGLKSRILIRDSWGTEIVPRLTPQTDDIIIHKTRFSSFYKTDLDSTLKKLGVKYLIVTGCTTSVCVESTVRDAMFRDYLSLVLEDCTAEPRGTKEASLKIIQSGQFGWVSNSEEFIKAIDNKKFFDKREL
jgi:ureidoacrylate peracid hydrolase